MIFEAWDRKKISRKPPSFDEPRKKRNALEGVDPRLKQIAYDRLAILREYNLRLLKPRPPKTRLKVMKKFLAELNSGMLWPDGGKPIRHVRRATLYNWIWLYKNGRIAALVPRYSGYKTNLAGGHAIFKPLIKPFKMKFSGPPRRNGKSYFIERIKRRWKFPPVECPIHLSIFYTMPIPKGTKMPRQMEMLKHKIGHTDRPHIDVLNAFVVDCLSGILFKNHSQIIQIHSEKHYGWWPQTEIFVRALKG
jgi:Holliday junction resolvase RusA-like endonuclease